MKKLREICPCEYDTLIKDIKTNSKDIKKGDLFVCIKGLTCDRHQFIQEAINNGASALIVERGGDYAIPFVKVEDTNQALLNIVKKFYEYDNSLKLIGVTGTDGKTTTTSLLQSMLRKCGSIGTNGVKGRNCRFKTKNTTPQTELIYKYLSKFKKNKLEYAALEVSSEGLLHHRVDGLEFDIGILTNVTEDHLNVHKTLTNYLNSKIELFKKIKKNGYAILNRDDRFCDKFIENCSCHVFTYGQDLTSDLIIKDFAVHEKKTRIQIAYQGKDYSFNSPLCGGYNVYNLVAALSAMICLGIDIDDAIARIKYIRQVPGRCEIFNKNGIKIVLDYAHTANGLQSILTYLNTIKTKRIITVVGSAGGREHEKRSKMGRVVQQLSDLVIYTMDDPRNEKVLDIIDEMIDRSKDNYIICEDRSKAIKLAYSKANSQDIILIAGKGRDHYMAIGDKYIDYCDYDEIISL